MNTQYQPARGSSTLPSTGQNTFMLPQPGTMGDGRAFSLSRVEALEYFANDAARVATGTDPNGFWQHRSFIDPTHVHGVINTGFITAGVFGNAGVRPAVWVSVN